MIEEEGKHERLRVAKRDGEKERDGASSLEGKRY